MKCDNVSHMVRAGVLALSLLLFPLKMFQICGCVILTDRVSHQRE
jgi:hypothetical protein